MLKKRSRVCKFKSDLYEYHIAMGDNTFQFQGAVVLEKGPFKPYLFSHGLASHFY